MVSWTQTRHEDVAVPSKSASWLTADAQLDNGFPLMLEVAGFDREPLQTPKLLLYSVDLRFCTIPRRLTEMEKCPYSIKPNDSKGLVGFFASHYQKNL